MQKDTDPRITVTLAPNEHAAILVALRYLRDKTRGHTADQLERYPQFADSELTPLHAEQIDALCERINSGDDEIQVVMECDGTGNYEPTLLTFDAEKAKAKYLSLFKDPKRRLAADEVALVKGAYTDDEGIEWAEYADDTVIKIDGDWYFTRDGHGDRIALWFLEDVE